MHDIYARCSEVLVFLGEIHSSAPALVDGELKELTRPLVWENDQRDNSHIDSYWDDLTIGVDGVFQLKDFAKLDHIFHACALLRLMAANQHINSLPPFKSG